MPTKNQIIIFGVLCVVAFGLGYWDGMPEKDSGQRAEGVAPTIITNVVTNIVAAVPQPTPTPAPPNIVAANAMNPIVEKGVRRVLKKPEGKLTKADLEKVTALAVSNNQLTDVKGLEKLTQLEELHLTANQLTDVKGLEKLTQLKTLNLDANQLTDVKGLEKLTQLTNLFLNANPDLTKAQIDELQKALPNCKIESNPTK